MSRGQQRGAALLFVALFGTLLLMAGILLVASGSRLFLDHYAMNRQTVCRHAAEGALQTVVFRASREADLDAPGWFHQARTQADPVMTYSVPATAILFDSSLGPASSDTPSVKVSILDSAEVQSRFGIVIGKDDYVIESVASLDGYSSTLFMRLRYQITSGDTSESVPSELFSKYLLWTRTQSYPYHWNPAEYRGFFNGPFHIEGDFSLSDPPTFGQPLTVTGKFVSYKSEDFESLMTRLYDWNLNNVTDTTARPELLNTSEAEVKGQSGEGKPSVLPPEYADIEARFLDAARTQTSAKPALAHLWIDSLNPAYAPGGGMYVGSISQVSVRLSHSAASGKTTAVLWVYGSESTKSASVELPPGEPTILLTPARISSLSGAYFANLTIATTYAGDPSTVTQYGKFNDPPYNVPRLPVLGSPAVTFSDHLINVDQAGVPKYWVYYRGNPYSAPSRLALAGVPFSDLSDSNVDNCSKVWNVHWATQVQPEYIWRKHASYNPSAPSVLGVYARGDGYINTSRSNHIGMMAYYGADSRARLYANPSVVKVNRAFLGSAVSPQKFQVFYEYATTAERWRSGFFWEEQAYDYDFLVTPPPYWIKPASSSSSGSGTKVTLVYGAVSHKPYE
jgi:hypothetical protein